jgi:hypothetical protein
MKYLNIILTLIAIMLGFIAFKLIRLEGISTVLIEENGAIIGSNQALMGSNHRLATSFDNLRQEIADLKSQLPGK